MINKTISFMLKNFPTLIMVDMYSKSLSRKAFKLVECSYDCWSFDDDIFFRRQPEGLLFFFLINSYRYKVQI